MKYYAILAGQQTGPIEAESLLQMGLTPSTMVWTEGMADWAPASTVPELAQLLQPKAPQMPPQPQPQPTYNAGPMPGYQQPQPQPQPQYAPGYTPQYPGNGMPPQPPSQLVWSILVTILCCVPFGIVAIVKSSQVQSLYNQGDYEGSQRASKAAVNWCIAGAVTSLVCSLFYFLFVGIGSLAFI